MSRTIAGTTTTSITLTTTANNPVYVTGRISVTSGVALTGKGGAAYSWTIRNSGSIIDTAPTGAGVLLGRYGTDVSNGVVTNIGGGLISASGTLGYGVEIYGPGTVTNLSNGTISAGDNGINFQTGLGSVVNQGVVLGGNVAAYARQGGTITNLAGGTISGASGVWFQYGVGTFTNAGVVIGSGGGGGAVLFNHFSTSNRLIVDPGAVFTGNISGGTGVMELASMASAGSLAGFGTTITNFSSVVFDSGAKWTVTGNASAAGLGTLAITGFTANDTIDVTGFVAVSKTFASNVLVLTNAGGQHATLHTQGAFSDGDFHISNDLGTGTDIIVCFAAGTEIGTPSGATSVEALTVGDEVLAHFAGSAPIQWISRRHVDCRRHPAPRLAWPVRVSAGAFGPGSPVRDLFLSPNHAVYFDGDLIPVRCLINGTSIAQIAVDEVTYYHLELPRHDLLLAEGLLTESYLDTGDRANFRDNGEVVRLHPDFATVSRDMAAIWETRGCAPLVIHGERLAAARCWIRELNLASAPCPRRYAMKHVALNGF